MTLLLYLIFIPINLIRYTKYRFKYHYSFFNLLESIVTYLQYYNIFESVYYGKI